MKIIIITLFLLTSLLGDTLSDAYNELNIKIDKLSPRLQLQDKLSLYYLSTATYATLRSPHAKADIEKLQERMFQTFTALQNRKNI